MKKLSEIRAIQYLGSKLNVKEDISKIISQIATEGCTIVDGFAGTGVIGNRLKKEYKIISNDVQKYSYLINRVLLSKNLRETATNFSIKDDLLVSPFYLSNKEYLINIFKKQLNIENEIINNSDIELLSQIVSSQLYYDGSNFEKGRFPKFDYVYDNVINNFSLENIKLAKENSKYSSLFTLYYLNGYFSLSQCIEIDSLRHAISKIKDEDKQNFALFLLLHAVSEVTCSVGKQFAQPLKLLDNQGKVKKSSAEKCLRDWNLKVSDEMNDLHMRILEQEANSVFDNEIYNLEIGDLIDNISERKNLVYYLDPPYTIDHYSRFYHILEVLIDYDYPELERKMIRGRVRVLNGRYPVGRFQSPLSIPSKAKVEFDSIFKKIASSGALLVLSYSDAEAGGRRRVVNRLELQELLAKYFNTVEAFEINHDYRKLNKEELNVTSEFTRELIFVGANYG